MTESNHPVPPRWPLQLLRFFIRKEYLEEIEGDMREVFQDNIARVSLGKAKRMYAWETLKLFRPNLIRNMEGVERLNQYGMFKNYFKVSMRGLIKNPVNSFINIFGLSLAIGMCLFVYAFANFTFSIDQFHKNKDAVYLVTFHANREGKVLQYGWSPRPLGEMLRDDFEGVKKMCRVEDRSVVMKFDDKVFREQVRYVDPTFLDMFTFPLKWGVARTLADANSVILSENMSVKYFGDENPIGQNILIKFDQDRSKVFKVTGVAKKFPEARTISFDFLINFENLRTSEAGYNFHDWSAFVNATFIQVGSPENLQSIKGGMEKYRKLQNESAQTDWSITSFALEPLATLTERSTNIQGDISRSSQAERKSVIYLGFVGAFMLLLACFNYINIAIVSAAKRLKEIGVRKSIGANRIMVVVQFLSENLIITCFAVVLGVIVGATVFIPGFEMLFRIFALDFKLTDPTLWTYLLGVLLFTSIASGIYPALYISNFQVVGILKGSVKFGRRNPLTKIFLGFQLILGCIFITVAIMFTGNSAYLAQRPWGYNQDEALYVPVQDQAAYEKLSAVMAQSPDVISISGSTHHLGKSHENSILHFPDREYEVDHLAVDARYFETMGLSLNQGRIFNDHENSDRNSVIVNEMLVKNLSWDEPIGHNFEIDSVTYEVIGVVSDFHCYNFSRQVKPLIFTIADKQEYRYLSMKIGSGSLVKSFQLLKAQWSLLFPEVPFEGGYQEDAWGTYYEEINFHGVIWRIFAFIAVSLASLGFYGLIRLNVSGRVREFSIRKVLGAGMKSISGNIASQYLVLLSIALPIGAPLGYMVAKYLITTSYNYHMPISFASAIMAVVILILVFVITVITQIRAVLISNPTTGLKVE